MEEVERGDHCRGELDKAVMDVNRQVSAASTAPLERMIPPYSGIGLDEWCMSIGKFFLTGVFKGKSQMVRAITAAEMIKGRHERKSLNMGC